MKFICALKPGAVIIVMLLGLLPPVAYAGKARTQSAPGVDLSQYKTYQWLPTRVLRNTGLVENDPVLTPLIKDAVNRELTRLGLKEVSEGGDLQVASGITTHAVPQVEAVFMPGPDFYYGTPVATMGRYNKKGALIVNLIDPKTKKSAWAGVAEEDVKNFTGDGQKKIAKAAENLFKKYPVKK
jgi:hypothetical protein